VFKPIRKFTARHDLATDYVAKVGHAPEVIAKQAKKIKADLIIMGSHGHGNLMNLVTGSVATQVLARSTVPVLLVR
jgi:nucleotide-binding universal stress UspA family protein